MLIKSGATVAMLALALVCSERANAWAHANYHGGGTYHAPGSDSTTRTDAAGGSETHTYGEGTTATGRYGDTANHAEGSGQTTASNGYGGTATHTYGQGTTASNGYGGSAYHAEGSGYTTYSGANGATAYHSPYVGTAYPAYHPPTTVNVYGTSCYNCGGWNTAGAAAAGMVVGAATVAAVASANTAVATQNAYAAGAANANYNNAAVYNAGVVAGATGGAAVVALPVTAGAPFAMNGLYASLPGGCISPPVQGGTYFLCGNTWFQPSFGANGVFYRVVPAP